MQPQENTFCQSWHAPDRHRLAQTDGAQTSSQPTHPNCVSEGQLDCTLRLVAYALHITLFCKKQKHQLPVASENPKRRPNKQEGNNSAFTYPTPQIDKLKQDCLKAQAVNAHVTSFIALQTHIQGRWTHNHVPIFVQQHLVAWARVQEPELGHVGYWILHHVMRVTPHSAEKKNTVCISPRRAHKLPHLHH